MSTTTILSLNCNGIKRLFNTPSIKSKKQTSILQFLNPSSTSNNLAEADKGHLPSLLSNVNPDIVFLQELKTSKDTAIKTLHAISNTYPHQYIHASTKKGYRGVAILSKTAAQTHWNDLDILSVGQTLTAEDEYAIALFKQDELDAGGRILCVQYDNRVFINTYTVNSGKDGKRLDVRMHFEHCVQHLIAHIQHVRGMQVILGGDMNVCPTLTKLDCSSSWFFARLPGGFDQERQMRNSLLQTQHLIDVYREINPKGVKMTNTVGSRTWRLDLWLVSNSLRDHITHVETLETITLSVV